MGCGAVCGNNSSIYQSNQYSQKIVFNLVPLLTHARQFISAQQFNSFLISIKQNPLKYRLKPVEKLSPKEQIDPSIMSKWKLILYCLDSSNQQYNNCLAQNSMNNTGQKQNPCHYLGSALQNQNSEDEFSFEKESVVFRHKEFSQIQKDIDRTGDLSDSQKKTFQKILKRISNHFPKMGYTQGINFIIGYLITIGYSQFDTFWMFSHIAINRRYLLLGLFQDGFPLSEIYKTVFKNILKRQNNQLYEHLYLDLNIDESVWVFKWFFTYFIYSFPHQMIKYVFDIVIQVGGIGLITFAIAITQQISEYLLQQNDVCEISMFFQSLKYINVFNQHISIGKVIQRAYKLKIQRQDFSGINTQNKNFYSEYVMATLQEKQGQKPQLSLKRIQVPDFKTKSKKKVEMADKNASISQSDQLINKWYDQLIIQRKQFNMNHQKTDQKDKYTKKIQRISIEQQTSYKMDQNQFKLTKQMQKDESSVNQNKNSYKDSTQIKDDTIPSTGCSFNKKKHRLRIGDNVSEIDELWDEQDRNSSVSKNISSKMSQQSRTQNGFKLKPRKTSYEDQLDKFAATGNNLVGKNKYSYNKTSSIFTGEKYSTFKPKINNFQIKDRKNTNHLARAGQTILTNLSITEHSQHESSTSQCSKFSQQQKKQKQNGIHGKNIYKSKNKIDFDQNQTIRTQQKRSVNEHNSSSRDSCIDPQNSFCVSNESIQDEIRNCQIQAYSVKAFESHRQRMNTQQDILTNSLHLSNIKEKNSYLVPQNNGTQIQIFQAQQVFKKKNRVSSRINGAIKSTNNEALKLQKLSHTISDADLGHKDQKSFKTIPAQVQLSINYQESYESIFATSSGKGSQTFRFQQQLQKCQIESVQ